MKYKFDDVWLLMQNVRGVTWEEGIFRNTKDSREKKCHAVEWLIFSRVFTPEITIQTLVFENMELIE